VTAGEFKVASTVSVGARAAAVEGDLGDTRSAWDQAPTMHGVDGARSARAPARRGVGDARSAWARAPAMRGADGVRSM
jgi:hypothetical protein